jgi:tRNA (adenine22-N1)-methyltransferase
MIKFDKRLQAVFDNIDFIDTIADIGTDHGKLIVKAVESGKAKKGIAIDISKSSLKKAELLAEKHGVLDKIQFICGNGVEPIEEKVDCVIIAGMGGYEIVNILSKKNIAKQYILVPHQDPNILREYLRDNNYFVSKDYVVKENKFYSIIVASSGVSDYTHKEIYLGKNLPESKYYEEFLRHRYGIISEIIASKNKSLNAKALDKDLNEEWEELNKWLN